MYMEYHATKYGMPEQWFNVSCIKKGVYGKQDCFW